MWTKIYQISTPSPLRGAKFDISIQYIICPMSPLPPHLVHIVFERPLHRKTKDKKFICCCIIIFQVIRRGDRRPFYAPAKYVVELRPEDVPASEMMASGPGGHGLHPNLNFSTFGPLKGKRSSYAPASGSSGVMLIPPPASSLESSGRLNDR